jgi:hypothetical protein
MEETTDTAKQEKVHASVRIAKRWYISWTKTALSYQSIHISWKGWELVYDGKRKITFY